MPPRRVHVIKIPTTRRELFPYSHYADLGHDPLLTTEMNNDQLIIECRELFKLKPNVQGQPRNRIDIYIPNNAGQEIGEDISAIFGAGLIAEIANVNPDAFRAGPQILPLIDETRSVRLASVYVQIAGLNIDNVGGRIYLDRERPNEGHIEMQGPEIHMGIPLPNARFAGLINENDVQYVYVPNNELRVADEANPIRKANGTVRLVLNREQARALAATLISYGQRRI